MKNAAGIASLIAVTKALVAEPDLLGADINLSGANIGNGSSTQLRTSNQISAPSTFYFHPAGTNLSSTNIPAGQGNTNQAATLSWRHEAALPDREKQQLERLRRTADAAFAALERAENAQGSREVKLADSQGRQTESTLKVPIAGIGGKKGDGYRALRGWAKSTGRTQTDISKVSTSQALLDKRNEEYSDALKAIRGFAETNRVILDKEQPRRSQKSHNYQ